MLEAASFVKAQKLCMCLIVVPANQISCYGHISGSTHRQYQICKLAVFHQPGSATSLQQDYLQLFLQTLIPCRQHQHIGHNTGLSPNTQSFPLLTYTTRVNIYVEFQVQFLHKILQSRYAYIIFWSNIRGTSLQMNSKDSEQLCDSDKVPLFRTLTQRPCTCHEGKWRNGCVLPLAFTSALAVSGQLHARAA